VRSIPLPAGPDDPALVVHVVPLRRTACDLFSGAQTLVAATAVDASRMVPSSGILMGLFDLTPAEARIAGALAGGQTLRQAAESTGIRMSTARAYLHEVFRKTGTAQQSQLVALLNSAQPL